MQIQVNVIGEMKKLRSNTYSDPYTWVDEVVQNCQRAKAKHIKVTLEPDKIIITDDGVGCSDPQVLFDKSTSGWDEATTANESPFGEGFFATMLAADTITVESIGFKAVFDVNKMFEQNTVDAVDVHPSRKKSGFTLTLTNLRNNIDLYSVEKRFKDTAKYIKSPTVSINGEKVHYEGLTPKTDTPFIRKLNTEFFTGWIRPFAWAFDNWSEDAEIKCFAYNRLVKNSTIFPGVKGVLNIKNNAVDLRSPDRKDFIQNEKYYDMYMALSDEIKKMYTQIVKTGDDEQIKGYQQYIKRYLDLKDFRKLIKFKFISNEIDKDEMNKELTEDITEDNNIEDNNTEEYDEPQSENTETKIITDINKASVTTKDDFDVIANGVPIAAKVNTVVRSRQTGVELNRKTLYGFYVRTEDISRYKEQISVAQYYDIPLIEVRNELEKQILEDDDRFNPIEELSSMMNIKAEYKNMTPKSVQETRISKLLSCVATAVGANGDLFIIADTKFQNVLELKNRTYVINEIKAMATAYEDHIYIDRRYMTDYADMTDDSPDLTPADIKFLLLNMDTIAHEMSHALNGTVDNTLAHSDCTREYMMKIVKMIYNKE